MPYSILHRPAWQVLFCQAELLCKRHARRKKRWGRLPDHTRSLILILVLLTCLPAWKAERPSQSMPNAAI